MVYRIFNSGARKEKAHLGAPGLYANEHESSDHGLGHEGDVRPSAVVLWVTWFT